jgi:hypothetical protein
MNLFLSVIRWKLFLNTSQISSVPSFPMMHADTGSKDKKTPTVGIASSGTVA